MSTEHLATMTLRQFLSLIDDDTDLDQPIRIWVEMKTEDDINYLVGRRLVGVTDDPHDNLFCLTAGYYREEDDE